MKTVEAVVAFVPMAAALAASFYKELGLEPGAPLRSLAAIDKEDLLEARAKMMVEDGTERRRQRQGGDGLAHQLRRHGTG